jgi:hypothetical protein
LPNYGAIVDPTTGVTTRPNDIPVTQTISDAGVDVSNVPFLVAMMQSAMLTLQSTVPSTTTLPAHYSGAITGLVTSDFTTALTGYQAALTGPNSNIPFTGTSPHMDGTPDCKTLALLLMLLIEAELSVNGGVPGATHTNNPSLQAMAQTGVNNMIVAGGRFAPYVMSITQSEQFGLAMIQFMTNINNVAGIFNIGVAGSTGTEMDYLFQEPGGPWLNWWAWAFAVGLGG